MKITIPGNKKTPEKTFESGVIYRSQQQIEGWLNDPMSIFFRLEDIDPDKNRATLHDIFRNKKFRISTK